MKAWLTVTLPPYKAVKSFILRGEKKNGQMHEKEDNFIDMMEAHFDTIWEHGSVSLEMIKKSDAK